MANDILAGTLILGVLTCGCLYLGWRLAGRLSGKQSGIGAAIVVALMVIALIVLQDSLWLAYLFPYPGVVVLGSTALPLIALLAGILAGRRVKAGLPGTGLIVPVLLLMLGIAHAWRPFWGNPPATLPPVWERGVFLQTSDSSCSAASAATLLHYYGIQATETEMANLCLTRQDGTTMLGVYRGLSHKTAGTPVHVLALAGGTLDDLRRLSAEGPILLSVGLDRFLLHPIDPRYTSQWGWVPGKRHAVVLFGFTPDGYVDIGDPSVGRERWKVESLSLLWHGDGIRLHMVNYR